MCMYIYMYIYIYICTYIYMYYSSREWISLASDKSTRFYGHLPPARSG